MSHAGGAASARRMAARYPAVTVHQKKLNKSASEAVLQIWQVSRHFHRTFAQHLALMVFLFVFFLSFFGLGAGGAKSKLASPD